MKIEKGKLVSLTYDLHLDGFEGELMESVNNENALVFIVGDGDLLESFEEKIMGLEIGDEFKFSLTMEEAYGDVEEDAFAEYPKDLLKPEEGETFPEIGDYIPMQDEEGNTFDGILAEIHDDYVIIDFNHPLAGEELFFTGKVIDIKDTE